MIENTDAPAIVELDCVDSTNKYALLHFSEYPNGTLICANTQTAGRGREGRQWQSPPGANLYCSCILKDLCDGYHGGIIAGLALMDLVHQLLPNSNAYLKWPNDLYINDKKLAGILCEGASYSKGKITGVVVGIGLNVNFSENSINTLNLEATSLSIEGKKQLNLKKVKDLIALLLWRYYIIYLNNINLLLDKWKKANALIGETITVSSADKVTYTGIFEDITSDGEMLIRCDNKLLKFSCGDVRICRELINWKKIQTKVEKWI